jgi:undecaprenyl-diphosphatase
VSAVVDALVALPPWLVLLLVFLLPAAEAALFLGLVVPGEIAVLVGGVVAHAGALPLWAVVVSAIAGATIGDQVGFRVGRRYGRSLLERLSRRTGHGHDVDRALALLGRRGAMAVVLGRWVAALRALVPGLAGMSGMSQIRFTVANVAGGALWATTVAVAGFLAGASYRALEHSLGLGGEIVLWTLVLAGVVYVVWSRHRSRSVADES